MNNVLELFQNDKLLRQLNSTNIPILPKVDNLEQASQFRLKACYNIIYKSKLICTSLKAVMSYLVFNNQKSFVQGRDMVHNIFICHELLKNYNRKTSHRCAMKISLRKGL